jgi:hypothetical protein
MGRPAIRRQPISPVVTRPGCCNNRCPDPAPGQGGIVRRAQHGGRHRPARPTNGAHRRLIGYARVSTVGQTLATQLEQLRAAGCTSRNIYREKVTGARADRRELNRMLGKLAPGDVVTVTRIDRLARQYVRPVWHRQAHRRRQGAIPVTGGAVGRHWHQHRALDAGGSRRPCRC